MQMVSVRGMCMLFARYPADQPNKKNHMSHRPEKNEQFIKNAFSRVHLAFANASFAFGLKFWRQFFC